MPKRIGKMAVNHFKNNFETESFEGAKWKTRSPKAPRNEGRKLLRDTGRLYRAIKEEVQGGSIRVFVAAPG